MPYPLEKLPYGIRRRLRELSTRSEAYDFQIAAPMYSGFQPIQKIQSLMFAWFIIDKENHLQKLFYPEQLENTPLFIVFKQVSIRNCTPNFLFSTILDDFRFAPEYLEFSDCLLDETFIQTFVNAVKSTVQHVELCLCSFTTKNAAKMLCNSLAFRDLKRFDVREPTFPSSAWWIEAFVETKCISLKTFDVWDAPISVFEIDKKVLLKFIKTQREDFILSFSMSDDAEWDNATEQRLNNLFDEHFEKYDKASYSPKKKGVYIYFDDEEKEHLMRSYVFRSD
uniref:F-box domain-containing protein n=1 Tax=Panagrellus redivivus TaxID=6233 RepID=A0A7E4VWC0_PANRE